MRQLDRLLAEAITRPWRAGAGPGPGRLVVDVDSFIREVHGYEKRGVGFGYTKRRGYHPLVASRADSGEVLHVRLRTGNANSSRGVVPFVDELIATSSALALPREYPAGRRSRRQTTDSPDAKFGARP